MHNDKELELPMNINIPIAAIADALQAHWDSKRMRCRVVEAKKNWVREHGFEPEQRATHVCFSTPGIYDLCLVPKDDWIDPTLFERAFRDGPEFLIGSKFCGLIIEVDPELSYHIDFELRKHS